MVTPRRIGMRRGDFLVYDEHMREGGGDKGAEVVGFDTFWQRKEKEVARRQRELCQAALRTGANEAILEDKKHHDTVHESWQCAHDAAATALHEHEVFFRDAIKTARHRGEGKILVRAKEGTRSLKARALTDSPLSRLFATCSSDIEFGGVAEAIEHWLGAQTERLGNVWVEYDGTAIPDIKTYDHKRAREDGEMTITWQ